MTELSSRKVHAIIFLTEGGCMPKDTFYNLSEEKRRKIFDAAVREFSTRRFSEASINQIIKVAEIPRGSFYQYFNDKEDIFQYMFKEIAREKQEIIGRAEAFDPDADVFEVCIQATRASYEWSKVKPEYSKIGALMELDNSQFIINLRVASAEGLRKMVERDKQRGLIRAEIDSGLVADIIYTLIIKEYFLTGLLDENAYFQKLRDVTKIIKEGISTTQG
jgi:AcrR family transcriptional regulator